MQFKQFGSYLVEEGYIGENELSHASFVQRRLRAKRIGEVLVEMGALSAATLDSVFVTQMNAKAQIEGHRSLRFGEFLVSEGLLGQAVLNAGLARQRAMRSKRLGEILVELGYMRFTDLERAIRAQLDSLAVA